MTRGADEPSPWRQALGTFIGTIVLSCTLALLLWIVGLAQLRPLVLLESLDEELVQRVAPALRNPTEPTGAPPVVFIDVDEPTMRAYRREQCGSRCGPEVDGWALWSEVTPRNLLAKLLTVTRSHGAAVVFLDIDLRQPARGDAELRAAIEKEGSDLSPVLLSRFIDRPVPARCAADPIATEQPPRPFKTVLDDAKGGGTILFVHPYLAVDPLGYVRGVCSQVVQAGPPGSPSTTLYAAAEAAIQLALHKESGSIPLQLRKMQFVVNQQEVFPQAREGVPASAVQYRRISADKFLWPDATFEKLKGAIVILGTSYAGSEQLHDTALGPMPGAVVHANAMLQILRGPARTPSPWLAFGAEILQTILLAAIYAIVFKYYGTRARQRAPTRFAGIRSQIRYFVLALLLSLVVAILYYLLLIPWWFSDLTEYALLAPLVVVCAEMMFEIAQAVAHWSEAVVMKGMGGNHT